MYDLTNVFILNNLRKKQKKKSYWNTKLKDNGFKE